MLQIQISLVGIGIIFLKGLDKMAASNKDIYNENLYCNWGIVYLRDFMHKDFVPFSFKSGLKAKTTFGATHMKNNVYTRQYLQDFADRYKNTSVNLDFQLRVRGQVVFQTIPHYE